MYYYFCPSLNIFIHFQFFLPYTLNLINKKPSFPTRLLVLVIVVFLTSCSSIDEKKTYSKNGLSINYLKLEYMNDAEEVEEHEVEHPVKISEKYMRNQLYSLWYRNIEPKGPTQPVFTDQDVVRLAPLFRQAFKRLKIDTYIHFEYRSTLGMTVGDVFSTIKKLHWRFYRINDVYYSSELVGGEPTWQLVRDDGQKLKKIKTAFLDITRKNWIVANIHLAYPKNRKKIPAGRRAPLAPKKVLNATPSTNTKPASSSQTSSIQKRLRTLKNLLEEGLINEKEYQDKKREILNEGL